VVGLAALLNLVSFTRDLRYWKSVLQGAVSYTTLPPYHLPPSVLPEWLLQTRVFYRLNGLPGSSGTGDAILSLLVPAVLLVIVVLGVRRFRLAATVVPLVVICGGLAHYALASSHCSYCEDRDLLPVAPLAVFLIAAGIGALAVSAIRDIRQLAVFAGLVVLGIAGVLTAEERLALANGGYMLDSGSRAVLSHLPGKPGRVELEAFGEVPIQTFGELPMNYDLLEERSDGNASIFSTIDDYSGLSYLGGAHPALGPEFSPDYRYVLTRAWGVQTSRRLIARSGATALEERTGPLDVTVVGGLLLAPASIDETGSAWVNGPMTFVAYG
jgi:hypothetical protein